MKFNIELFFSVLTLISIETNQGTEMKVMMMYVEIVQEINILSRSIIECEIKRKQKRTSD